MATMDLTPLKNLIDAAIADEEMRMRKALTGTANYYTGTETGDLIDACPTCLGGGITGADVEGIIKCINCDGEGTCQ